MTSFFRSPLCLALAVLTLATLSSARLAGGQERSISQDRWPRSGTNGRREGDADEASKLYAEARLDLEAGRLPTGQRKLEVLVARFPSSPLADVARRDLQRLYAGTLGTPPTPAPVPAARPISDAPSAVAPVAVTMPPVSLPPVSAILRAASEDFRHLAGDRVFFADSSVDLGGRAKSALEAQAAWLIKYPGIEVTVEGYSDDHGSRDFNRTISEKRAYAVKLRLNDLGVSADRIGLVGFGRDRPIADCAEPNCTAQNRRVVTTIVRVPSGLTFDITRGPDRSPDTTGVPVR